MITKYLKPFAHLSILVSFLFLSVSNVMAELPKSVRIDQQKKIILNALNDKDCKIALEHMEKLESLSETLSKSFHFFKGDCYFKTGQYTKSLKVLESYLKTVDSSDEYYERAIDIYTLAEGKIAREKTARRQLAEVIQVFSKNFVVIPSGTYIMGSKRGDREEMPVHRVTVKEFAIGKYEVTQSQWQAVMGDNPSYFSSCDSCPVENVSWDDVHTFLKKLNKKSGKNYRLPSEAEWEYACRGGRNNEDYCGSNSAGSVAWYSDNSGDKTHPVGQKLANDYGLYDMSGNVREWMQDCWNDNYSVAPSDGSVWKSGDCDKRVLRGGSWYYTTRNLRATSRNWYDASSRGSNAGFRIARTLTP